MILKFLLKLLSSLIAAGIVLILGYGSIWLLQGATHYDSGGDWLLNVLGIILGLIGLVICLILIGAVVRYVWGRR